MVLVFLLDWFKIYSQLFNDSLILEETKLLLGSFNTRLNVHSQNLITLPLPLDGEHLLIYTWWKNIPEICFLI